MDRAFSDAVNALSEIKLNFSNMGYATKYLVSQGFDSQVAKKAVRYAMSKGPDVQMLRSFGNVSPQQAAQIIMRNTNAGLGETLDALIHSGLDANSATEAINSIDLDTPEVNDFTNLEENPPPRDIVDDNAGNLEDISAKALDEIERLFRDHPQANIQDVKQILDSWGTPQDATRAFVRQVFASNANDSFRDINNLQFKIQKDYDAGKITFQQYQELVRQLFEWLTSDQNDESAARDQAVRELMEIRGLEPESEKTLTEKLKQDKPSQDYYLNREINQNDADRNMRHHEVLDKWPVISAEMPRHIEPEGGDFPPHAEKMGDNPEALWHDLMTHLYGPQVKHRDDIIPVTNYEDEIPEGDEELYRRLNEYADGGRANNPQYSKVAASFLTWEQVATALNGFGLNPKIIERALVNGGATSEEAAFAISNIKDDKPNVEDTGESDGPTEDMPIDDPSSALGGGPDMEGPPGLIDGGIDPASDMTGTGGMGTDEQGLATGEGLIDMPETDDPDPAAGGRSEIDDWADLAHEFLADDPQISHPEMTSMLTDYGLNEQEARKVADKLNLKDSAGAIQVGASVTYRGESVKVDGEVETLYGKMFLLSNGHTAMCDDDELDFVADLEEEDGDEEEEKKESSLKALISRVDKFNSESYTLDEAVLRKKAQEADVLYRKLDEYQKIASSVSNYAEAVECRKYMVLLASAKEVFEDAAIHASKDNRDYLNSQPKFQVGAHVYAGNEVGPGGSEAISLAVDELREERANTNWDQVIAVEAASLVDENPQFLSSAGEIRRVATRTINPKVSHLEGDEQEEIRNKFYAAAERARRLAVRELGKPEKVAKVEEKKDITDEGVFF